MAKQDVDKDMTNATDPQEGYTEFGNEEGMADDQTVSHEIRREKGDQKEDPGLVEEDEDLERVM